MYAKSISNRIPPVPLQPAILRRRSPLVLHLAKTSDLINAQWTNGLLMLIIPDRVFT